MASRFVVTTLCLALASPVAFADEPPPEAKRAFAEGKAAYDHGDYDTALRDFQRAQLIAPPSLYYNIGMAYERLGRFAESASSFDKYLAQAPPARTDEERAAQAKVRERATADRARAQGTPSVPPPTYTDPPPYVAPQPQQPPPPGYAPYYYYPAYGQPMMPMAPPLSREERIRRAKGQRTTGIVLLSIGGAFLIAGSTMLGIGTHTNYDAHSGYVIGMDTGGVFALVGGIAIAIPGAVVLAKGQTALNTEKHTPDDSAATRHAALDLAAPGVLLARPTLGLSLPPIRF